MAVAIVSAVVFLLLIVWRFALNVVDQKNPEDRAQAYLRRVIALTGATRTSECCVLDVGNTRFCAHPSYVIRLRDESDSRYALTCFYVADQEMPPEERIATALLHLKSNPALFDGWTARQRVYKADGQVFGDSATAPIEVLD